MDTKLIIKCDIKHAQEILYSASKIIERGSIGIFNVEPSEADNKSPEIGCNFCDWTGNTAEMSCNDYGNRTCPKCWTVLVFAGEIKQDDGIDIYKFMALDDEDKLKYYVIDPDGAEYDIAIFDRRAYRIHCDICGVGVNIDRTNLIGTSDTREPKFCYVHYIQVNQNSTFYKGEQ